MKKLLFVLTPVFLFSQQFISSFSDNNHNLFFAKTFEQQGSTYIMTYFDPIKKSIDRSQGIEMIHFNSNNQLVDRKIITLNGKPVSYGYTIKVKSREGNKASVDMIRINKTEDAGKNCEFSSGILNINEGKITDFKTHYTVPINENYRLLWHNKQWYLMRIDMKKNLFTWTRFDSNKPKVYPFTMKKNRLRLLKNNLYFYDLRDESAAKETLYPEFSFIRFLKDNNGVVLVNLFNATYMSIIRYYFPISITKFDFNSAKISYKDIKRSDEQNAKKRSTAVGFLADHLYYTKLSTENKIIVRQLNLNSFKINDFYAMDNSIISNKDLPLIKYNYRVNNDKKSTIKKSDLEDMLKSAGDKTWSLKITPDKANDDTINIDLATIKWLGTIGQGLVAYATGFFQGPLVPKYNKLSFSFNSETQQIASPVNRSEYSFTDKYYQHIAYFRKNYEYGTTYKGSMKIMYDKISGQYEIIDFDKPFNLK